MRERGNKGRQERKRKVTSKWAKEGLERGTGKWEEMRSSVRFSTKTLVNQRLRVRTVLQQRNIMDNLVKVSSY